MTPETRKQVLENLRRIDWLAAQVKRNPDIDDVACNNEICRRVIETIRLIESEPNQPVKANE